METHKGFKIVEDITAEIASVNDGDVEKASLKLVPVDKGYEVLGVMSPALIFLAAFIEKMRLEMGELKSLLNQTTDVDEFNRIDAKGDALNSKINAYVQFLTFATAAEFDLFGADHLSINEGWVVSAPPVAPCGHRHAPQVNRADSLSSADFVRQVFADMPGVKVIEL